jgi:hypothetical protein
MTLKTDAAKDILGYSEKIGKMGTEDLAKGFEKYKSLDKLGMLSGRGFGEGIGGGFKGTVKGAEGEAGFEFDLAKVEHDGKEFKCCKGDEKMRTIPPEDIKQAMKSGYENMGKKMRSMTLTRDVEGRVTELLEVLGEGKNVKNFKENEAALKRDIESAARDSPMGIEKSKWEQVKGMGKYVALAGGGYIYLVDNNTQAAGECHKNCLTGENDAKGANLTPPEHGGECPSPENKEECKTYCKKACSSENRTARGQHYVRNCPLCAAGDAGSGLLGDLIKFWHYAQWFVYGFAILLGLFLIYKFTSSYATGKAAKYSMSGLISGVGKGAAEMKDQYATAQSITNTVKPAKTK